MTDAKQDNAHAADNMISALEAAEQQMLEIASSYDPRTPRRGCLTTQQSDKRLLRKYRRLQPHLRRFDGDIFDYAAAFSHDEHLVSAVPAAVRIAGMAVDAKHLRTNIRQMRSLLRARVSPAVLSAFRYHLYTRVISHRGVEADRHFITGVKRVLVSAESQLGAENLDGLHAEVIASMLVPRFAEYFDVPLES